VYENRVLTMFGTKRVEVTRGWRKYTARNSSIYTLQILLR